METHGSLQGSVQVMSDYSQFPERVTLMHTPKLFDVETIREDKGEIKWVIVGTGKDSDSCCLLPLGGWPKSPLRILIWHFKGSSQQVTKMSFN